MAPPRRARLRALALHREVLRVRKGKIYGAATKRKKK
jgi:hypothetical protein